MKQRTRFRDHEKWILIFTLLLFAISIFNLITGKVTLSLTEFYYALLGNPLIDFHEKIIWNLRIPRGIVAIVAGGMLGLAGAILQSVTRNELAEPGILGVTSGSVLFAVVWLTYSDGISLSPYLLPIISCIGGLFITFAVFYISSQSKLGHLQIALVGVILSSILQSFTTFVLLGNQEALGNILLWIIGSLNGRIWIHVEILVPIAIVSITIGLCSAAIANGLRLGDHQASLIGLNVKRARLFLLSTAAILTAGAISVVGAIGFIGLIGPHIAKKIVGEDARKHFPLSALISSFLLVLSDAIAQSLVLTLPIEQFSSEVQLPTGAITALLGAPFFMYLLSNKRRRKH